ncbi:LacI family DNA-binding transcriptional regulator [Thermogemmatispora onikobensis]|uniref:LacI family DNA-binding transcriptional regulator n=1 Tax=Thermogemmatispora onikobensis TaxID=732234 RepID=UPI000A04E0A8|nr:LacI family DNA-binding transcriptional regulator [Thermogemmatispora onikobensis]
MSTRMTISDIARLAGVSKATVSRVLNHKPDVDPVTRERILRIMEEHNFVPSVTASGLAAGKGHLIGVLVPALTWPLIPDIMRGIAEVVEETSYELVLYSIKSSNHERDRSDVINRILANRLIAGLLAIFPGQSARYLPALQRQGLPVVLLDDQGLPPEQLPWITADNRAGAYAATRHLIELGHRRIAHIQGPLKYQVSRERFQGYCEALQDHDIPLEPSLILQGDFMPPGGRACACQFFAMPERSRPTAIFAASDLMAYGVMGAAEEFGLRIPEDVSLVGFDDISSSGHMRPPLTTVRQPLAEMGRCALELLLSLLETPDRPGVALLRASPLLAHFAGSSLPQSQSAMTTATLESAEPVRLRLATTLVVRATTAPPPCYARL